MSKRNYIAAASAWLQSRTETMENWIDRHIFGNVRVQRLMPYWRPLLVYLLYLPSVSLFVPLFRYLFTMSTAMDLPYANTIRLVAEVLLSYAMLHSLLLTFAIYNRLERKCFLQAHPSEFDRREERHAILHSRDFWISLGVLQICFLLHPHTWGQSALAELIPWLNTRHVVLQKLLSCLPFFALTLWFSLRTRLEARTVWIEAPAKLMRNRLWKSLGQKKRKYYSLARMLLRLFAHGAVYALSAVLLPFLLQVLYNFLSVLFVLFTQWWLWMIVGAWLLWILLRAIVARIRFIRRLKKVCRENGFELFDLHGVYRSLFFDSASYTFGVSANRKTYYCRLLSCIKRSNNIHISPDGTFSRLFTVRFPTLRFAKERMISIKEEPNDYDLELFSLSSSTDYTFEADGHKILLLNPVAKRVYAVENGKRRLLDNGSTVGDYKIFTGNAFLRALERDCADR